jgi:hypothetical protein
MKLPNLTRVETFAGPLTEPERSVSATALGAIHTSVCACSQSPAENELAAGCETRCHNGVCITCCPGAPCFESNALLASTR